MDICIGANFKVIRYAIQCFHVDHFACLLGKWVCQVWMRSWTAPSMNCFNSHLLVESSLLMWSPSVGPVSLVKALGLVYQERDRRASKKYDFCGMSLSFCAQKFWYRMGAVKWQQVSMAVTRTSCSFQELFWVTSMYGYNVLSTVWCPWRNWCLHCVLSTLCIKLFWAHSSFVYFGFLASLVAHNFVL